MGHALAEDYAIGTTGERRNAHARADSAARARHSAARATDSRAAATGRACCASLRPQHDGHEQPARHVRRSDERAGRLDDGRNSHGPVEWIAPGRLAWWPAAARSACTTCYARWREPQRSATRPRPRSRSGSRSTSPVATAFATSGRAAIAAPQSDHWPNRRSTRFRIRACWARSGPRRLRGPNRPVPH